MYYFKPFKHVCEKNQLVSWFWPHLWHYQLALWYQCHRRKETIWFLKKHKILGEKILKVMLWGSKQLLVILCTRGMQTTRLALGNLFKKHAKCFCLWTIVHLFQESLKEVHKDCKSVLWVSKALKRTYYYSPIVSFSSSVYQPCSTGKMQKKVGQAWSPWHVAEDSLCPIFDFTLFFWIPTTIDIEGENVYLLNSWLRNRFVSV